MAYATTDDIKHGFDPVFLAQLADDAAGVMEDATIMSAILDEASSEIDSYLSPRFDVPLATVPTMIRRACINLALYYLHVRRGWTITENFEKIREHTIEYLNKLRVGDADIPSGNFSDAVTSHAFGSTRSMTAENLTWF